MIQTVTILGSGSAGLIAALTLKRGLPRLTVRIVRSPEIGIIGVGEGTTPNFVRHIFDFLGISRKEFYSIAQPTWKLGIRFLWGPRRQFYYSFAGQLDSQFPDLPMPNGFYCDREFAPCDAPSHLMAEGKVFPRQPNGAPDVQDWHAFHIENVNLVACLEKHARAAGVEIIDANVTEVKRSAEGIESLHTDCGQAFTADLFVDASGFRSELLGKTMEEPFVSFENSLFCDRAVAGGWERGAEEPILPYTTAETMDAGWCWQIEHEHHVNRGYVFSSAFLSDDQAVEEFRRKNPKAPEAPRIIRFRSGVHQRLWVGNTVAIGNAAGFVEPLEASALMVVCSACSTLVKFLSHVDCRPTATMRDLYNKMMGAQWLEIRDFLALHYKFNTLLDTPFWRHCVENTDISGTRELLEFYHENGPTGFGRYTLRQGTQTDFGMEGYLVMLTGMNVPHLNRHQSSPQEQQRWADHQRRLRQHAERGLTVKESLYFVHHPGWRWNADAVPH